MVRILRHCQPKGAATARPNLQRRASTPPLHLVTHSSLATKRDETTFTALTAAKSRYAKARNAALQEMPQRARSTGMGRVLTRAGALREIALEMVKD